MLNQLTIIPGCISYDEAMLTGSQYHMLLDKLRQQQQLLFTL